MKTFTNALKFKEWLKHQFTVLKSSWLSLICILAVIVLSVNVKQGQALILQFFDDKIGNLVFFILQVLFMALVVSHYPNYLLLYFKNEMENFDWKLNKPTLFGFGIVSYDSKTKPTYSPKFLFYEWRKFLGVLFLCIATYVFKETHYMQITFFDRSGGWFYH